MTELACFGLPSVFNSHASYCGTCEGRKRCEPTSHAVVKAVEKKVDVRALVHKYRLGYAGVTHDLDLSAPVKVTAKSKRLCLELDEGQRAAVANAPVKVAGRLESVLRQGLDRVVRVEFAQGVNPFLPHGAKHMHVAGQLLLQGGFTKAQLREALIIAFGWKKATAFSQVSEAVALLRGMNVIVERGDRIELPTS